MIHIQIRVWEFIGHSGKNYFLEWLHSLPMNTQTRIRARIFRVESGNIGDYKHIGHGVYELRLMWGAGYRIYFGFHSTDTIVLLVGGNKNTQNRDITLARHNWVEYKLREHGKKKR